MDVIFKCGTEGVEEVKTFDDDFTQQDILNEWIDWIKDLTDSGFEYVD